MEEVPIGSGNGQTPSDHNRTTYLLNRLDFPAPSRGTVVEVAGNDVPGAVGQRRCALLPGLEVPWINGSGQIRQGLSGAAGGELGTGCLSAVRAGLEH